MLSVQINLSPTDLPVARHLLRHQLTFFRAHATEFVLTVESRQSGGRFGARFQEYLPAFRSLLAELAVEFPNIRVCEVDYSPATKAAVAKRYFAPGVDIPDKDYRGGPFYSYLFGLHRCTQPHILHFDSDMFFGGQADAWLDLAYHHLAADPRVLFVNPLAGPPRSDFSINQSYHRRVDRHTYAFATMSTRLFLTTARRLDHLHLQPVFLRPTLRRLRTYVRALRLRNRWLYPEEIISHHMQREHLIRLDCWGPDADHGCYSLHPIAKTPEFCDAIPALLRRMAEDRIPDSQRGCYDINNELFQPTRVRQSWTSRVFRRSLPTS